jgi:hypothetical protein
MKADPLWEIETAVREIEALDAASGGQFRQASDREAYDIVCRIERKLRQKANLPDEDGVVV